MLSFFSATKVYSSSFLNYMELDSGDKITVTSGMGHKMEGKAMVDMDMLCHRLRV
jgi:hypothetical protein